MFFLLCLSLLTLVTTVYVPLERGCNATKRRRLAFYMTKRASQRDHLFTKVGCAGDRLRRLFSNP
jgi:hypothetical protein